MTMHQPAFLQVVFQNVSGIPLRSWLLAVAAGALLATPGWLEWRGATGSQSLEWVILAAAGLAWAAATYTGLTAIIARPTSVSGGLRFLGAEMLLWVPFVATLVGMLLLEGEPGAMVLAGTIILLLPVMMLLPAWPVAVSVSRNIVSPLRVFRATKGHRWGLVMASIVASAPNRLTPDFATATDGGVAGFYWLLDAALTVFTLIMATSTTATAWQYAVRNDEGVDAASP
jgi:hypothetical protein